MKYRDPFCFLLKTDYEVFRDSEYTESGRVWNVHPNAETVPLYLQSDFAFEMYEALQEAARVLSDLPSTNQAGTRTRAAWERAVAVLAKVDG